MSKEHAYAYEAGYRDGSINYELEHCPACKNVADLQEALAENAKLREQCARLFDKTLELGTENSKLRELCKLCEREAENDKLRELVLCLLTCHSDDSSACDKCPVNGGHGIWEFEDFCDSLLDRVHELKVEVKS